MTTYIVLRRRSATDGATSDDDAAFTWIVLKEVVEAASADGALRSALSGFGGSPEGTYVAVPARSWNPQPVSVETNVSVKIGAN